MDALPAVNPVTANGVAPVIQVAQVSRWFGSVVAVSDVTFDIMPGITGLLGPNGAGKTTLLRMITGLAHVSDGSVTVFGQRVRDNPPLYARMGVMSEHETVYNFMTWNLPRRSRTGCRPANKRSQSPVSPAPPARAP